MTPLASGNSAPHASPRHQRARTTCRNSSDLRPQRTLQFRAAQISLDRLRLRLHSSALPTFHRILVKRGSRRRRGIVPVGTTHKARSADSHPARGGTLESGSYLRLGKRCHYTCAISGRHSWRRRTNMFNHGEQDQCLGRGQLEGITS